MKTRCKPGDRCVIVAEIAGCERNIGARVTVTDCAIMNVPGFGLRVAWRFKDASRPLIIGMPASGGRVLPGEGYRWITSSDDSLVPRSYPCYDDSHLVPIAGDGEQLLDEQPAELTA